MALGTTRGCAFQTGVTIISDTISCMALSVSMEGWHRRPGMVPQFYLIASNCPRSPAGEFRCGVSLDLEAKINRSKDSGLFVLRYERPDSDERLVTPLHMNQAEQSTPTPN